MMHGPINIRLLSAFEPVKQFFLSDSFYFDFMTDSFFSNLLLEIQFSGRVVGGIYTGWVGAGKWQSQWAVVCPCGAVRSPVGSGGGRVYISACAVWITVAYPD